MRIYPDPLRLRSQEHSLTYVVYKRLFSCPMHNPSKHRLSQNTISKDSMALNSLSPFAEYSTPFTNTGVQFCSQQCVRSAVTAACSRDATCICSALGTDRLQREVKSCICGTCAEGHWERLQTKLPTLCPDTDLEWANNTTCPSLNSRKLRTNITSSQAEDMLNANPINNNATTNDLTTLSSNVPTLGLNTVTRTEIGVGVAAAVVVLAVLIWSVLYRIRRRRRARAETGFDGAGKNGDWAKNKDRTEFAKI